MRTQAERQKKQKGQKCNKLYKYTRKVRESDQVKHDLISYQGRIITVDFLLLIRKLIT